MQTRLGLSRSVGHVTSPLVPPRCGVKIPSKPAGRQTSFQVKAAAVPEKKAMAASITADKFPDLKQASYDLETLPSVELPILTESLAKDVMTEYGFQIMSTDAKDALNEKRRTSADVTLPKSLKGKKGPIPVVLFAHGFSQPPVNYTSIMERLASDHNAMVLAPNTSIFDIANPFKTIGGSGGSRKPPTKMQAALLVDLIRAAAYLKQEGIKASKIVLAGHSMGAGLSLVLAPLLKNVGGVVVAAPAVKQLMEFPLNPSIHMKSDILGRNYKEAEDFFMNIFPDKASLHLIAANQDQIVRPIEVAKLFSAARQAVKAKKLEDVVLFRVDGSHVGFEDKLSLEKSIVTDNIFTEFIFGIVNLFYYRFEILKGLLADPSDQLAATREIMSKSLLEVIDPSKPFPPRNTSALDTYDVGITDDKGNKIGDAFYRGEQLDSQDREQIDLIIDAASQLPTDPSADNADLGKWLPATLLLVAYTVGQGVNSFTAFKLVWEGLPFTFNNIDSLGGMLTVGGLAFALVYENGLLAGGRFIGEGPLLQALSQWRFVAHAFAPALTFVAAELADRGGVTWATEPGFQSLIGLAVVGMISTSFISSYFLLETQVLYEKGIVRYGYRDPTFVQVLPVITASILMIILGWAGKDATPALQPLAFGPIASFLLAAIPPKVAPAFLAGNLGEVILLASLVAAEVGLRSSGL
eukprot:jgi/Botrbrau1/2911/Bobra.0036s0048.1